LESNNLKLDKYINAKPNICKFINKLISEERDASIKLSRLSKDSLRPTRLNKDAIGRDNNILKLKCVCLEKKLLKMNI
jgi:hypothetical protein